MNVVLNFLLHEDPASHRIKGRNKLAYAGSTAPANLQEIGSVLCFEVIHGEP